MDKKELAAQIARDLTVPVVDKLHVTRSAQAEKTNESLLNAAQAFYEGIYRKALELMEE